MNIVILTSTEPRHKYFCSELARWVNVLGILVEEKRALPSDAHFKEFAQTEERYFSDYSFPIQPTVIPRGTAHEHVEWIRAKRPSVIIVFGTGMVREPILSEFTVINLHLGLSPYYKGSGTNFWALAHEKPECVGVTIHEATGAVDGGPIYHQIRPPIMPEDAVHDIGCKAIISGVHALHTVLTTPLNARPQKSDGLIMRSSDFSSKIAEKLKTDLPRILADYLQNKEARDASYPLITV